MINTLDTADVQSAGEETVTAIGGYSAVRDPRLSPNVVYQTTREEDDRRSLTKLWECGFTVDDLDQAHREFRISPLRTTTDIYRLLGHVKPPEHTLRGQKDKVPWFTAEFVTSLAFVFPNPQKKDEVYPHDRIVRVRYPQPLVIDTFDPKTKKWDKEARKYGQPAKVTGDKRSTAEPYFLLKKDMWDKVRDPNRPLYVTESELKACALGLAGFAAIGFSGINMWGSPKGRKHQLHPALDPNGPWAKGNTIPVEGREVVIMFDTDANANALVAQSARSLAKALMVANAKGVRIAKLPAVGNKMGGTGVDDFLLDRLGPRWSGDGDKLRQAKELIEEVVATAVSYHNYSRYKAYSVVRTGERLLARLALPESFAFYEQGVDGTDLRMRVYDGSEYLPYNVGQGSGATSGKVIVSDVRLQTMARDEYERGVNIDVVENGDDPEVPEMPTDFPNRVFTEVVRGLPRMQDGTFVDGGPPGVRPGDRCVRTKNAVINVSRFFDTGGDWEARGEWLLAPDYRFVSTGALSVRFPNQRDKPACPLFMDMVTHGFDGDPERVTALRNYFGKVVCNPWFHGVQRVLCLFGTAGGGKSTTIDMLVRMVGHRNTKAMDYNKMERFDLADLPGKRLVVFPETGEDSDHDKFCAEVAALIKKMSSGDMVRCEAKGRDVFTAYPTPEVVLVSNPPPIIPMDSGAFERRAQFLRWENRVKTVDFSIPVRMAEQELPGILLWALEGAMAVNFGGEAALKTPEACLNDLRDATEKVDPVTNFVRSQIRITTKADVVPLKYADIAAHFQQWCVLTNCKRNVTPQRLGHMIGVIHGVKSVNKMLNSVQTRVYPGMELSDPSLKRVREIYGRQAY